MPAETILLQNNGIQLLDGAGGRKNGAANHVQSGSHSNADKHLDLSHDVAMCKQTKTDYSRRFVTLFQIQSLLIALKDDSTRDDFLSGKIMTTLDPDMILVSLDAMHSIFFPRWSAEALKRQAEATAAADHLENLCERKDFILPLSSDKGKVVTYSYASWMNMMESLLYSEYWHGAQQNESVKKTPDALKPDKNMVSSQPLSMKESGKERQVVSRVSTAVVEIGEINEMLHLRLSDDAPGDSLLDAPDDKCTDRVLPDLHSDLLTDAPHSRSITCTWCLKVGHLETHCRRKLRLCLICGADHQMKECPRHIANKLTFKPTCCYCTGEHLGMYCPDKRTRSRLLKQCHFCGRAGHMEDSCWRKQRVCLRCGSSSHQLRQCPLYVDLNAPMFPSRCNLCGRQHFGNTCACRYME